MKIRDAINSIYHIALADFLQRIRSYSFLITLGFCIFIMYSFVPPISAGYRVLFLGNYRGFYNSAWIGNMVAMCAPIFALISFYLVNNAVKRDIDTGVGQIIATTRISGVEYLSGKLISNFAVLLIIVLVIAVMTVIMFLIRGETTRLELGNLLFPILIYTIPAMFITSALALFFDSLSGVSRGLLNISFFFLWVFLLGISQIFDVFGFYSGMAELKLLISSVHTDWNGGYGIGVGPADTSKKVFILKDMIWSASIVMHRIYWMLAALAMALSSSVIFKRFDASEIRIKKRKSWIFEKKSYQVPEIGAIKIRYNSLPPAIGKFSYPDLIRAEFGLMLKGNSRIWFLISSGLFIASVFTPLDFAYMFILPLLWYAQIFTISQLGSREITNRCDAYIFSSASPLIRQLPVTILTPAILMYTLAIPVSLKVLFAGNFYGFYAIAIGAMFIPVFAIALGIITAGSKLFEVIFTIMVYGIINKIPWFDFTGAVTGSQSLGIANYLLVFAIFMLILAFIGRMRQIRHA